MYMITKFSAENIRRPLLYYGAIRLYHPIYLSHVLATAAAMVKHEIVFVRVVVGVGVAVRLKRLDNYDVD